MGRIDLKGVRKSFGAVEIIKGVDLEIADGLRGVRRPLRLRQVHAAAADRRARGRTSGQILIDGADVIDLPPAKRGLSMVFQSYALYPHMTVRNNIGFGLKMAGMPKAEIERRSRRRRAPASDALPRPQAAGALRRTAPARRDRPRHRARAEGVPVRRAAVQPRRGAARPDAPGDRAAAEAARRHHDLRHPRPGRGHDHGRQDRGPERRQGRAGRLAARALRTAGQPVRRRLHRLAQDELRLAGRGRRRTAPPPSASGRSTSRRRASAGLAGQGARSPSISAAIRSSMSMPGRSAHHRARVGELAWRPATRSL